MVYLDNNATTKPTPAVGEAMRAMLTECWQNPSSLHRGGQEARRKVELARRSVASLINASAREVVFTGGGTEAIDMAIRGTLASAKRRGRSVVVTTAVEHAAVRELTADLARAGEIELRLAPLTGGGVVDVDALAELLTDDVAIVSVQWANNETGAIQPVERIGELCRSRKVVFHCDGTQWIGKAPADARALPVDLLGFSAHKFHGPKGVGALYIRRGVRLAPVLHGSQELGRRGGTENTAGIVGMGVACDEAAAWLSDPSNAERMAAMRDRFERAVLERAADASVNAPPDPPGRLWNTANIAFPSLEAEALLMLLSERGLCASAGSACSSGSLEPSPVLLAMGIDERRAHGSIRFSLSRETTDADVDEAVEIVAGAVERLRRSSAAALG